MFFIILGIAYENGWRWIVPDADGGVGGFVCWKKIFGKKQIKAIIV